MSEKLRMMLALDVMRLSDDKVIRVAKLTDKLQPNAIVDGEIDFWEFSSFTIKRVHVFIQMLIKNNYKDILSDGELKKKVLGNEVLINAVKQYLPDCYIFKNDNYSDGSSSDNDSDSSSSDNDSDSSSSDNDSDSSSSDNDSDSSSSDSDSDSSSDEEVVESTSHCNTEENFKKLLDSSYYCNVVTDDTNKSVKIIIKRDIKVHLDLSESDTDDEDEPEPEELIPLDPRCIKVTVDLVQVDSVLTSMKKKPTMSIQTSSSPSSQASSGYSSKASSRSNSQASSRSSGQASSRSSDQVKRKKSIRVQERILKRFRQFKHYSKRIKKNSNTDGDGVKEERKCSMLNVRISTKRFNLSELLG
ncbi:hypothetical protein KQX54_003606 [Cotesia glomerata]|uniref:Uncharacterized protein n=1 Tax=Cotesia glomerata TaxID=32391 RepID=A0AAV7I4Y8_COTGL|nr:hypothetical protein KQX54_003606 [Cotesia glomerata]